MVPPFYTQDTPHLGTKWRNRLLKTLRNIKLPFGNFFIEVDHLQQLIKKCSKDKHQLSATTLNPIDKQNYSSVLKICSPQVMNLLNQFVESSDGTRMYLQIIKNFIDAFTEIDLSPLDRVFKVWYALFIVRLWRKSLSPSQWKSNFLTSNTYACVEQNAHSLVKILIYLKNIDSSHLFMPWLLNSQPCEHFFRLIRSLTTVFSRVANCSVKEILERINKIQLLGEISFDPHTSFLFPQRLKTAHRIQPIKCELPTQTEISEVIIKSKEKAINDAIRLGLLEEKGRNIHLKCEVLPLDKNKFLKNKMSKIKNVKKQSSPNDITKLSLTLRQLMTVALKNYSRKFIDKKVESTSSYTEIYGGVNRIIVKKSSLVWLLRSDTYKLSSDRLERVKGPKNKARCVPRKVLPRRLSVKRKFSLKKKCKK